MLCLERADAALHHGHTMSLSIYEHVGIVSVPIVLCASAIDFHRAFQWSATFPFPYSNGITGLAHGAGTPVASDQQRVLINPLHPLLATRHHKSVLDKLAALHVEFA